MDRTVELLHTRCIELLPDIGLYDNLTSVVAPLTRYILSMYCALPIKHIILAERPYATDIHPYVASAMSYDPACQHTPTPSVHYLALDLSNKSDILYDDAVRWFRDSWQYLCHGVIALNVCTTHKFMDGRSERERSKMEEFIRDLIRVSIKLSEDKIHVYAMGNPAKHSASRIRASVKDAASRIRIHKCDNPAALEHRRSDHRSRTYTLLSASIVKLLSSLIRDTSRSRVRLTFSDFDKMAAGQPNEHSRLVNRGNSMADVFTDIEAYFKGSGSGKMVERNDELFGRAAKEMKEFVLALQSNRVQLLFANLNEPSGTSKQAYYNTRQNYNRRGFNPGTSSKAPSSGTPGRKQKLGFADGDDNTAGTSTPDEITKSEADSRSNADVRSVTSSNVTTDKKHTTYSTPSRGGRLIGFAEEDEDTENERKPAQVSTPVAETTANTAMSDLEVQDMSYVSDFIETSEEYIMDPAIREFLHEAVRNRKASSDTALEVLKIIRETRTSPNQRSIESALGYDDLAIVDMPSPIMQWIISQGSS
ncbi:uncharacterized protein PV06_11886 [Exophiala oligosperma]|uniref:Uncharacterized protein n=1 Tax=Exophiala oligosperma TaxID=215243 RepID=A0A0D2BE43_9EURO|nr:uncharacterized protein PV06_11886 [Exophiala oligosperma]KIW35772.1 hypothetical protein PV06_11886 [Exophiala oligosperma]